MELQEKDIIEFQKLFEKIFGKKIEKAEALEKATRFLNLLKIVFQSNEKEKRKNK